MDIEQVRQFVEVMHTGSVSAAAKNLNISQPALSRSLRRFEDELGGPLFDRTSNSMTPNEQARVALPAAEDIVRAAERMRESVVTSRQRSQMLRIGTVAPAPLWYLSTFLVNTIPGTMFRQDMLEENILEQRLYGGEEDLIITLRPVPGMVSKAYMNENLFLSAPADHPLARRSEVSFADLDGDTYILYDAIGFWREVHDRLMPHAMFIRQDDHRIFRELMRTTRTLGFASDAPMVDPANPYDRAETTVERVNIPITDPEAHATFYLVARPDTLEKNEAVAQIMRTVPSLEDLASEAEAED